MKKHKRFNWDHQTTFRTYRDRFTNFSRLCEDLFKTSANEEINNFMIRILELREKRGDFKNWRLEIKDSK
jgi:hypothetical protein